MDEPIKIKLSPGYMRFFIYNIVHDVAHDWFNKQRMEMGISNPNMEIITESILKKKKRGLTGGNKNPYVNEEQKVLIFETFDNFVTRSTISKMLFYDILSPIKDIINDNISEYFVSYIEHVYKINSFINDDILIHLYYLLDLDFKTTKDEYIKHLNNELMSVIIEIVDVGIPKKIIDMRLFNSIDISTPFYIEFSKQVNTLISLIEQIEYGQLREPPELIEDQILQYKEINIFLKGFMEAIGKNRLFEMEYDDDKDSDIFIGGTIMREGIKTRTSQKDRRIQLRKKRMNEINKMRQSSQMEKRIYIKNTSTSTTLLLKQIFIENQKLLHTIESNVAIIFIETIMKLFNTYYSSIPLGYYGDLFITYINHLQQNNQEIYDPNTINSIFQLMLSVNSDDYYIDGFINSINDIILDSSDNLKIQSGGNGLRGTQHIRYIFNNFTLINPFNKPLSSNFEINKSLFQYIKTNSDENMLYEMSEILSNYFDNYPLAIENITIRHNKNTYITYFNRLSKINMPSDVDIVDTISNLVSSNYDFTQVDIEKTKLVFDNILDIIKNPSLIELKKENLLSLSDITKLIVVPRRTIISDKNKHHYIKIKKLETLVFSHIRLYYYLILSYFNKDIFVDGDTLEEYISYISYKILPSCEALYNKYFKILEQMKIASELQGLQLNKQNILAYRNIIKCIYNSVNSTIKIHDSQLQYSSTFERELVNHQKNILFKLTGGKKNILRAQIPRTHDTHLINFVGKNIYKSNYVSGSNVYKGNIRKSQKPFLNYLNKSTRGMVNYKNSMYNSKLYYINNSVTTKTSVMPTFFCPISSILDGQPTCRNIDYITFEGGNMHVLLYDKDNKIQLKTHRFPENPKKLSVEFLIEVDNEVILDDKIIIQDITKATILNARENINESINTISKLLVLIPNRDFDTLNEHIINGTYVIDQSTGKKIYPRREILKIIWKKMLGDFMQELNIVTKNSGYTLNYKKGETILDKNEFRLGLANDRPSAVRMIILTIFAKSGIKPNMISGYINYDGKYLLGIRDE
tara:strand:+ start:550 stop:3648 length:3099 start_codon:yes stop_codon:yes gene_type:complete